MRLAFRLTALLLTALVRLLSPGGAKAPIAENLMLRYQLLVLRRKHSRAPNLRQIDRLLLEIGSLLLWARRISKGAVVVRSSTLCDFTARWFEVSVVIRKQGF